MIATKKEYNRENRYYSIKPGEKFGYLEVLCYTDRKNVKGEYKCLCVCGGITYKRTYTLKKFPGISCGCKNAKNVARAHTLPDDLGLYNGAFYNYKKSAEKRDYEFVLDFKTFKKLLDDDCHYCGSEPIKSIWAHSQKRKFSLSDRKINGIDRKDNTVGYTKENCVTACYICNNAKNIMSEQEFLDWANKIYSFQFQKRSTTIREEYTQVSGNGDSPDKNGE